MNKTQLDKTLGTIKNYVDTTKAPKSHTHNSLKQFASRPASANLTVTGDNTFSHFKSTSTMTEGKPAGDGHVVHFEWDNTGGWSSQVYVPNRSNNNMQFRGMNAGTWDDWVTLAKTTDNVASATKLQTARKIGQASFDGTANISLRNIAGSITLTSSGNNNKDKYIKFATIDCSGGTYRSCSGTLIMTSQEGDAGDGLLHFHFRTGSAITSTSIVLKWVALTNAAYANRIIAVKVSDGKYDLYLRPTGTYHTQTITIIDCYGQDYITLAKGSYVDSVTAAATSSVSNGLTSGYLPLAGGTLTGDIKFNKNDRTGTIFNIFGGNANGHGVNFGGNGTTIVSAGESGNAIVTSNSLDGTVEDLYLTADQHIRFYTNCNTIDDKKSIILSNSLNFYPAVNNTGTLGTSSYKWNSVNATTFYGALSGNASTATKLATARTITLTGDVSGSASFDGSANVSITTAVANDSHTHSTYLPKAGGTMTGAIKNASLPSTYVTGATGAFIVSSESAGTYQPMMAAPTTNGSMVLSVYQDRMEVDYLTKANVDAGTNTVTKSVKLATEAGGGEWPGQIVAGGGVKTGGNIVSDTAISDSLGTAAIPFSNAYAKTIHAYGEANKSYGSLSATTVGTTSTTGETRLTLGNSTASGTASNSRGRICMYGTNTGYTWIVPGYNDTSNITLTLPSSGGTLARTADNVASATKLKTARTITLTGDVSGSASFDGSANVSITTAVTNDSHTHSTYLPLAGGTMTGNITLNNNIKIRSKTPAAYTNSSTSATVASGTSMTIFHYNSAGNLHIGDELYSNRLDTGNVYLSSPNDIVLRTGNGKSLYFKYEDSTKMTVNSSGDLSLTGNIYLANNKAIGGKTADGSTTRWLTYVDTSNNSVFGNTSVPSKLVGNPISVASKIQMNKYALYLMTTSDNARMGVSETSDVLDDDGNNTWDVYIANSNNNWFRLRYDKTITYGGAKVAIDGQTIGRLTASNWWYSTGNTGWYNSTYNGGWYMTDASWVRSYADKGVYTGGKFKTTNEFLVEKADGNTFLVASRTDTDVVCKFGVGSGGSNHGVFSGAFGDWIVYGDATNKKACYLMQSGGTAGTWGHYAFRYGSGLSGASGYITFSW